jgi:antitoxin (DNA-binding transcriptional repressor) of toxin-antitoxin stability system
MLIIPSCDAIMYHMRKASVRDLRFRFAEVEDLLRHGEEIEITKRRRVIAKLIPVENRHVQRPDVLARLKELYGNRVLKVSGAELLAKERERF